MYFVWCSVNLDLQLQDDYYVFMLSDANLAMYGVSPKSLATALMSDPMVNSYAIFIAGEAAAESLKQEMPVGHARTYSQPALAGVVFLTSPFLLSCAELC
jgi:hypothetical protein